MELQMLEQLALVLDCNPDQEQVLAAVRALKERIGTLEGEWRALQSDLSAAQANIRAMEGQVNRWSDNYSNLLLAINSKPHEDPVVVARDILKKAELLLEAHALVDPYGDEQGLLPEVLRRIRNDLEISSNDDNTSFRDAIISIKDERDAAQERCGRLADELDELKRQYHDGDDACRIAGRILGNALLVMQGKQED